MNRWIAIAFALALTMPALAQRPGLKDRPKPQRPDHAPAAGSEAPDFDLSRLIEGEASEDRVKLSSFRGKRPVVLVFGSYT